MQEQNMEQPFDSLVEKCECPQPQEFVRNGSQNSAVRNVQNTHGKKQVEKVAKSSDIFIIDKDKKPINKPIFK